MVKLSKYSNIVSKVSIVMTIKGEIYMAFCTNCGEQIQTGAKFCANCGASANQMSKLSERKTVFVGEVHKCPNCGELLKSFETVCPTCQFELRGTQGSNSIKILAEKLEKSTSEIQKITIIKNFPVPNTKEDIFEFMFLAYSNFDAKYYVEHLNEEDMSDAWLTKIEQCYQKAKFLLSASEVEKIDEMYSKIKKSIQSADKKNSKHNVGSIFLIVIGILIMPLLSPVGLVMLICGIARLAKNEKKNAVNQNKSQGQGNVYTEKQGKTGFSTWSIGAKIFWVILNIYTCGIPAIVYVCCKK